MQEHVDTRITVDELARRAGLSRAHFIRRYKQAAQRTPMQDLRMIRVELARELLLTTDLPLKAIAARTGFCDEYHLSRTFKALCRVTPGYFRKRRRPVEGVR
jgi:transcriptional regulator GlxA family with amidase domain